MKAFCIAIAAMECNREALVEITCFLRTRAARTMGIRSMSDLKCWRAISVKTQKRIKPAVCSRICKYDVIMTYELPCCLHGLQSQCPSDVSTKCGCSFHQQSAPEGGGAGAQSQTPLTRSLVLYPPSKQPDRGRRAPDKQARNFIEIVRLKRKG